MAKATVPADIALSHRKDCPLSSPPVEASFATALRASRAFSKDVLALFADRAPEARAKWAEESVEAGRFIFQPWNMEIVFVLAVSRQARFGELQRMLGGISSRTLSDKLQTLRDEGLVDREVFDEQPVRIEYRLTKEGLMTAALATPLFAHLNHRKMWST